ncbi:SCO family protein [Sporosarcina sp. Marseille-Q4063]|uniref:SCO family protein n=1 Tax=Sporosarcina sp. Marseille-Q4063 TaxID=2810514 RepID=UPI001BAFB7A8|nr:SCO family protein [Sporosarcina sp. Marseille-Q4063]QUW20941.1 SCO family protein [Sporosarcina sp. Marseille-Q4063]
MRKVLFLTLLISTVVFSACGKKEFIAETDWKVEDFSAINQENQKVDLADLEGEVWIADFIFTNCATVCPPMTMNKAGLQQALKDENINNVRLVSFSVDPEFDTPEVLKEYATAFDVDQSNWDFLTGYNQEDVVELAKSSFKAIVQPDPNSNQVTHGTSFYLVNPDGIVVKNYSGFSDVPYEEIVEDVKLLITKE